MFKFSLTVVMHWQAAGQHTLQLYVVYMIEGGAKVSTVAAEQEGTGFKTFLGGFCMLSPSSPAPPTVHRNTFEVKWLI